MLSKQFGRILSLALENQKLARIERAVIVRMAHIYQRKYKQGTLVSSDSKDRTNGIHHKHCPMFG